MTIRDPPGAFATSSLSKGVTPTVGGVLPATTVTTLSLVKANQWRAGYEIQDLAGNTSFVVASEGVIGYQQSFAGEPIFAAVIKAPGTTVITAVVVRNQTQVSDCFEIYTITANYDGQKSTGYERITSELRASLAASTTPLYLCSKLSISCTGRTLTYYRCQSENESDVVTFKAKVFPLLIVILSCGLGALCATRKVKFYEPGQRKKNVPAILCRKKGIVEVAEGLPLFEAVCIAYALDRLTTISCEEFMTAFLTLTC